MYLNVNLPRKFNIPESQSHKNDMILKMKTHRVQRFNENRAAVWN